MTTEEPTDIQPKLCIVIAAERLTTIAPNPKQDRLQIKQRLNQITCRITERVCLWPRIMITMLLRHDGNQQLIYIYIICGTRNHHQEKMIRGTRSQEMTTAKYHWKKITGNDHGGSKKSTKISTKMPTELPTKKQSTTMSTLRSTGRSLMISFELHHREASTSQCQFLITTDIPDTTRRIPILYEAYWNTVQGLGRAQVHWNSWWV